MALSHSFEDLQMRRMDSLIGEKLGPYEILALIGSGGMGEVWKARDTRLGRIVAIKKLKERHGERFKKEARSIAALNHPYICQIYDVGPDYLVLEYVEGKPLSGPIPEQEAVRLAIQIAAALEEAHQRGIVHRDLKPSNIMVTDKGSVKLLDFGLAKLYEDAGTAALPGLSTSPTADYPATQTGAILGTAAYMSPEQAQGKPADARSDIFSFGLVLYEMLSGKRAFSGDNSLAILAALQKEEPPPLKASSPLEKIVSRCLAKPPSGRYQIISEVRTALEPLLRERETMDSDESQPSVAVLPFVNMSGDKEQEYFSDGLAEEIINALTKIPGLKVAGRTSSFYFRGKDVEFAEMGKKLNVENILEGSVRKAGSRIRVTAQLIKVSDGFHLWSERYDRDLTDVFAIQDEISEAIAGALKVKLSTPAQTQRQYEPNLAAHEAYLKARYQWGNLTPESIKLARTYFEQAIAADPNYAQPWVGLAVFYWFAGVQGMIPPKAANAKCWEATLKALELDESLSEAHSTLGLLMTTQYDWKGAEREFRRALELGPKVFDVWMQYSLFYLAPARRLNEAITATQRAVATDPLSPIPQTQLGNTFFYSRQFDRAIEQYRKVLEINPNYAPAHLFLGFVLTFTGKHSEGIAHVETGVSLFKRSPVSLACLGWVYAKAGRTDDAQKLLAELQDVAQKAYVSPYNYGMVYLGLGEIDQCFYWLEKAIDERDSLTFTLPVHPFADPLRSDARYKALLRKMNLEP
jgi:serine/threonine protein kinase/Tfp pilus assembly protein PilF